MAVTTMDSGSPTAGPTDFDRLPVELDELTAKHSDGPTLKALRATSKCNNRAASRVFAHRYFERFQLAFTSDHCKFALDILRLPRVADVAEFLDLVAPRSTWPRQGIHAASEPGYDAPTADDIADLLSAMPNLRDIHVRDGSGFSFSTDEGLPINGSLLLRTMLSAPIPNLRSFTLMSSTIRESELMTALFAFKGSLKELYFHDLELTHGTWLHSLRFVREQMTGLEKIDLGELRDDETGEDGFFYAPDQALPGYTLNETVYLAPEDGDGEDDSYGVWDISACMEGRMGIEKGFEVIFGWDRD